MKVSDIITRWRAEVIANPDRAKRIGALIKLVVSGAEGGVWFFDCKRAMPIETGQREADCTVHVSDQDILEIATGKLNPQAAFLQHKLRIDGKFDCAIMLHELFSMVK